MFHTPSIEQTEKQAEAMNLPLLVERTKGIKEKELEDLERVIKRAKQEHKIDTVVTGALHSEYQASRIQKICDKLNLKCFNPLWHKEEIQYLKELIRNKFEIMIIGVFAFPLNQNWLGKRIDKEFIVRVEELKRKYNIHPAGEGGEFETFVLNCPLFNEPLKVKSYQDFGEGENSWRREIKVE
jgi:asparagine synthase (glutamine-hydrolysing)